MVRFRSSDPRRGEEGTGGPYQPERLVTPVASIDGWTLEGTPLDGVVPVEDRSELTALLHTIGIGAQTAYVAQRAVDLLIRCGQYGQALAVCDTWFAQPEAARAGGADRGLIRRRARLRERFGLPPVPAAAPGAVRRPERAAAASADPSAAPDRPGSPQEAPTAPSAPPAAPAAAAPAAEAASAQTGRAPETGTGPLAGAWDNVRAHMPPASAVARHAGRARERVAVAARRVLPGAAERHTHHDPDSADARDAAPVPSAADAIPPADAAAPPDRPATTAPAAERPSPPSPGHDRRRQPAARRGAEERAWVGD